MEMDNSNPRYHIIINRSDSTDVNSTSHMDFIRIRFSSLASHFPVHLRHQEMMTDTSYSLLRNPLFDIHSRFLAPTVTYVLWVLTVVCEKSSPIVSSPCASSAFYSPIPDAGRILFENPSSSLFQALSNDNQTSPASKTRYVIHSPTSISRSGVLPSSP